VQTVPSALTENPIFSKLQFVKYPIVNSRGFEAILTPTSWEEKPGEKAGSINLAPTITVGVRFIEPEKAKDERQ